MSIFSFSYCVGSGAVLADIEREEGSKGGRRKAAYHKNLHGAKKKKKIREEGMSKERD